MNPILQGQVAVVTGAKQGIGAAFAQALADKGAAVAALDIGGCAATCRSIQAAGGKALDFQADVLDRDALERVVAEIVERFGRIDVLVASAAVASKVTFQTVGEISSREWTEVMEVNVRGTFESIRAVTPVMKAQGQGKIVTMGSGTFLKGVPFMPHYVASKGAVVGLTRSLARELGTFGIRVNCISPGLVITEDIRANPDMGGDEFARSMRQTRAIQRDQTPDDLLGALIFLCSSGSDFISGQTLVVDGGSFMS